MILLKTQGELDLLEEANRIVHAVLDEVGRRVRPGFTTFELDGLARDLIQREGAVPAFLNYNGFPATLCTSVNDVVVHGIPDDRPLQEGDIVGVDCGVVYRGYFGDAARTFAVGLISEQAQRLLVVTQEALHRAVDAAQPGGRLGDIGHAVQEHVEANGFTVVREFVGHGIGAALHEDPQVPNVGIRGRGRKLRSGMVLAIEPMVAAGTAGVKVDSDGWTARTKDGSLSAHFEFSVAITDQGSRVLGRSEVSPQG